MLRVLMTETETVDVTKRSPWGHRLRASLVILLIVLAGLLGQRGWSGWKAWSDGDGLLDELPLVAVARVNLVPQVTAYGKTDSAENTLIECQLEEVEAEIWGYRDDPSSSGSSTIIELVPEGTMAKAGQVLARLDSSEYDELIRIQEISTERALADMEAAQLDLQVAEETLREYQGTKDQTNLTYQGQIEVSRTQRGRSEELLKWAKGVFAKGLLSEGQLLSFQLGFEETEIAENQATLTYDVFNRFTVVKDTVMLQNAISQAKTEYLSQKRGYDWQMDRLNELRQQVEHCTIQAPHDGMVIYANDDDDDPQIALGSRVYRRMDMFRLPNLEKMIVQPRIHESMINRVREGMRATATLEGLSAAHVEGTVIKVNNLPLNLGRAFDDRVKYYEATIQLDRSLEGLLPGMTAEVVIDTITEESMSLVVPPESVILEGDSAFCYRRTDAGLERREVVLGRLTPVWQEILGGLEPGEQVVLDPRDAIPAELVSQIVSVPLDDSSELVRADMPLTSSASNPSQDNG